MSVLLPVACRDIDADHLLVKADRSGTRIRVVSEQHQSARCHRDDGMEQLNEQFALPVTVDPYRVTARLEDHGLLVIEAPLAML